MQELNLRLGQAVALTYAQTDENFKRLKTAIDALEVAVAGAGLGTVTSVGLTLPNIFTVTNSPVTTTGSLTATLASQSANRLFASPNGSAGTPTFRSLVAADLGAIVVPIANGGTGLASPILNNYVLASNGSAYQGREILVGTGLTLTPAAASFTFGLDLPNINITGLGGVLTSAQGGTGISTAPANGSLLIGNGTSWTNALLTAGTNIAISNGVGSITISTSGVVTGSGTSGYLTKFGTSTSIGDSLLYELASSRIGLGTITPTSTFHILGSTPSFLVETNSGTAATIRASNSSTSTSATLNSGGVLTTLATNFTVNTGLVVYPTGNVQTSKGFALNGFDYWNTASNYVFSSDEQYGVILGPTSPGTMTVTLPTAPMAGQEICILVEENKTLTVDSGVALRNIYGLAAVAGTTVVLAISLNTHASAVIFKFSPSGNGGAGGGAWYLTGF